MPLKEKVPSSPVCVSKGGLHAVASVASSNMTCSSTNESPETASPSNPRTRPENAPVPSCVLSSETAERTGCRSSLQPEKRQMPITQKSTLPMNGFINCASTRLCIKSERFIVNISYFGSLISFRKPHLPGLG